MKNLPAVRGIHLLFHTRQNLWSSALSISALLLRRRGFQRKMCRKRERDGTSGGSRDVEKLVERKGVCDKEKEWIKQCKRGGKWGSGCAHVFDMESNWSQSLGVHLFLYFLIIRNIYFKFSWNGCHRQWSQDRSDYIDHLGQLGKSNWRVFFFFHFELARELQSYYLDWTEQSHVNCLIKPL